MALIVENGTGLSNAESYTSVAEANAYHAARGNTNWATISTGEAEQALRRATDYIEQVYRLRWQGNRVNSIQALSWPRAFVQPMDYQFSSTAFFLGGLYYLPADEVPQEVKNACAEMAFKAAGGELASDLTQGIIREKVDVLEVQYDPNSPQYTRYRAIDNLLRPFLTGGSNSAKVQRV
jgi:hypothetical protein